MRHEHGERRKTLAEPPGPELPGEEPRDDHRGRARERRRQPDGHERIAEQRACRRGDHGDKGRVVDIAPVEVLAAGDVVELVAEPPVALDDEQVEGQLHAGEPEDDGGDAEGVEGVMHK